MIYYSAIVISTIFIIFIINMVRKNKLDEKYSILWLIFGSIILGVSIAPTVIIKISGKFDIYYPPALLFLLGIIVLVIYTVHITVVITKQNKEIVNLTQKVALMERENERNKMDDEE